MARQHPERYCKSAKSLVGHLAGLCGILEAGGSCAAGDGALRRWLDGKVDIARPALPAARGEVTVASVAAAADPAAHARAVEAWARAMWRAYAELAFARSCLARGVGGAL